PPQTRAALDMYTYMGGSASRDAEVVVCPQPHGGSVVRLEWLGEVVRLEPHADVRVCAVSPDGRWAVTASHGASEHIKIWDAATGQHVKDFPASGLSGATFSPDGRWVVTASSGGCPAWA